MKKIYFNDLSWPAGLNLDLLKEVCTDQVIESFILNHSTDTRSKRRIILPSSKCIKKVVIHYFVKKVLEDNMTWKQVMSLIQQQFTLRDLNLSWPVALRLYQQRQREKEIEEENKQ
jgi:hypothetical protein